MSTRQIYDRKIDSQRNYWQKKLAGVELGGVFPGNGSGTGAGRGEQYEFVLPEGVAAGLERITGDSPLLLYAAMLSALKICLYRYNGGATVVVGSPARQDGESGEGRGNVLPIVSRLGGEVSFQECLLQVRETLLEAYRNQGYSIDGLRRDLKLAEGEQLFEVVMSLKQLHGELGEMGVAVKLELEKAGKEIRGKWEVEEGWWERGRVRQYTEQMIRVLEAGLRETKVRIRELRWMEGGEQERQLGEWNRRGEGERSGKLVTELLEEQVRRTPTGVAMVYEGQEVSYEELNRRANRLGRYLRQQGVGAEARVVLHLRQRWQMVVGMLGVLKAGGVYVPLDPEYPVERRRYIVEDAQAAVMLTEEGLKEELPLGRGRMVCVDGEAAEVERQSGENLGRTADLLNLAYVIYTSGSSGEPKGVGVTQESLAERALALARVEQTREQDRILQFVSPSFDAFCEELYPGLIRGAALVMGEQKGLQLAEELLEQARRERITVLHMPPAVWMEIQRHVEGSGMKMPESLRLLVTGGEAMPAERVWKWKSDYKVDVCNMYGPTETTITATAYGTGGGDGEGEEKRGSAVEKMGWLPVGWPIANTQVYVLDEEQQVVPAGVAGELYIGGVGVARGYLRHADLTAEKFVPHPFVAGERVYRSGDWMKWNARGELEFLGRKDQQVKIRGYRIELGEIEAVLSRHEKVKQAVVEPRSEGEEGKGEKRLVGYVVAREGEQVSGAELRRYLEGRIPEYMIPGVCMVVKELPMTATGKVDRKRLPAPVWGSKEEYIAPRTPVEEILAQIWAEVLRLERVGVDQNFFELGGDSILVIQIVARANRMGLGLKPQDLFEHQTIQSLAAVMIVAHPGSSRATAVLGTLPLTPAQRWFLEQDWEFPEHCNQSVLLRPTVCLSPAYVESAVEAVLENNVSLQLRFKRQDGQWKQTYSGFQRQETYSLIDLSRLSEAAQISALENAAASVQASLNLGDGPLIRVVQFVLEKGEERLLIVVHHLVIDVVSWSILVDDLQSAYYQISRGEPPRLFANRPTYTEWPLALPQYVESGSLDSELKYWTAPERRAAHPLPCDFQTRKNDVQSREIISIGLDVQETEILLKQVVKANYCDIVDILLAATVSSCAKWTGHQGTLLDMEGHGRENIVKEKDFSGVVGCFTTIYPVFLQMEPNMSAPERLQSIRNQLRGVPQKGIGYGLLRYMAKKNVQQTLAAFPQSEISFNFLGVMDSMLKNGRLFEPASESKGSSQTGAGQRRYILEITGKILHAKLWMDFGYSRNLHRAETIHELAARVLGELRQYTIECRKPTSAHSSDFKLAKVSQQDLDTIFKKAATSKMRN